MNNKTIVAIVVAVVVLGVGTVALTKNNNMSDSVTMTHSTSNDKPSPSSLKTQDTNKITYKGFDVVQKSIRVKKGATVTWTNEDNAKHDVTPDTETADFKSSELFGKGETHSVTFNTVGTYTYHCSPHPYMKGTIEVTE